MFPSGTLFLKQEHRREGNGEERHATDIAGDMPLLLSRNVSILYLDLNLHAAGELELHQGIDSLGGRAVDVDQTLVV